MPAERAEAVSPEALIQRVEELTARVEDLPDPAARRAAEDLMSAVIDMYGLGLARIVEILNEDEGAGEVKQQLVDDGVVASLLLIHDLYPVPIEERVTEALDNVRPTWSPTAATWSWFRSRTASSGFASREAATAARPLRPPWSWRSRRRSRRRHPTCSASRSRGIEQDLLDPVEVTGTPLPVVQAGGSNGSAGIPAPAGASGWHELNGQVDGLARTS